MTTAVGREGDREGRRREGVRVVMSGKRGKWRNRGVWEGGLPPQDWVAREEVGLVGGLPSDCWLYSDNMTHSKHIVQLGGSKKNLFLGQHITYIQHDLK